MNLKQLIEFFDKQKLKNEPIRLNQATVISNPEKFVESHLNYLKSNKGNRIYKPYFDRLLQLYKILNNEKT